MTSTAEEQFRIAQFVQLEGMLLDTRSWDEWLALYEADCEYWVPMWDDSGVPTSDPNKELSLIYYESRSGLDDRVFRIKTGKSSASTPDFRTTHMRTMPLISQEQGLQVARFNWVTHAFRSGRSACYFGRKTLWLKPHDQSFRIAKSYTLVCNDLIDQVLDVYHL